MDFAFLLRNLQIAYPFKNDVVVTRPAGDVRLSPLMAALRYYTYDRRAAELYVDEIDLRSTDSFATLSVAKAELRWSDGATLTLEDGVTAEAKVYSYGTWIVVTWRRTETGEQPAVLHIVFPSAQVVAGSPDTFRFWKKTDDIEVLAALVKQGPGKVRRVFVKRGSTLEQVVGPGEPVLIGKGFNMSIEPQDATLVGGRQLTPLVVNVVPGAGMGQYLRCIRNAYLLTLTGVPPSEIGDAKLTPEECYWLERAMSSGPTPLETPEHGLTQEGVLAPHELQLHNSCGPCCSCADYVATYNHARDIWDRAKVVSDGFYALRIGYYALIAKYLAIVEGLGGVLTLSQYLDDYMVVLVRAVNDTDAEVAAGVTISLDITMSAGTYTYVAGTGRITSSLGHSITDPTDPDGDPVIEIDLDMPAGTIVAWSGMWSLGGVVPDDTVDVTALIGNGLNQSEAEILTIE